MTPSQRQFLLTLYRRECADQPPLTAGAYLGANLAQVRTCKRDGYIQDAEIGDPVRLSGPGIDAIAPDASDPSSTWARAHLNANTLPPNAATWELDLVTAYLAGAATTENCGRIIHILLAGYALCAFSTDLPKNWPKGHQWCSTDEADEHATCPRCRERFQATRE